MVSKRDYSAEVVEAAHSVLLELVHMLGEYRDDIVLIGGWVPIFICPGAETPHVGSMDIDVAINHKKFTEAGYKTIHELLLSRDYKQGSQPFIFHREVTVAGRNVKVQVDLLAGQYEGTGPGHRKQQVQDIRPRKARGADLAFDAPVEVRVQGHLPEGGEDCVNLRVVSVVPFLIMKAMALDDRLKEKDSWDIYYCVRNYQGGVDRVIEEFKPHLDHGLVREGLEKMARHFASIDSIGPTHVSNFEEILEGEARDILRRDAYERIQYLLKGLGFV